MLIVDPPSGWKHGFPKPFTFQPSQAAREDDTIYKIELENWFIKEGYPRSFIDSGLLKWCRYWSQEKEDC